MKEIQKNKILEVNELKTYYISGNNLVKAVDGVSFDLGINEKVGFVGESGSGKTQTMLSIMGINAGVPGIIDGTVKIEGRNYLKELNKYCIVDRNNGSISIRKDIYKWNHIHEKAMRKVRGSTISMIFQEPKSSLSPFFTVERQLYDIYRKRYESHDRVRFLEMINPIFNRLQFKKVNDILKKYPHQLSGGESQRIMLAMALLSKSKILIADEPTTALDAIVRYKIIELFKEIIINESMSVIYVTHNLNILQELVDKVIVMYGGKVVEIGAADNLMMKNNDSLHPYTQFLKSFLSVKKGTLQINKSPNYINRSAGCSYYERCHIKDGLSATLRRKCRLYEPPLVRIDSDHYMKCWAKGV